MKNLTYYLCILLHILNLHRDYRSFFSILYINMPKKIIEVDDPIEEVIMEPI